jgi:imidazolonepropionase-like amidohydrolase
VIEKNEIIVLIPELVIDGTGANPKKNTIVAIDGPKIIYVGHEGGLDLPPGKKRHDIKLQEKTLLPGLIDSHIHLALGTQPVESNRGFDVILGQTPTVSYLEYVKNSDGIMLASGIYNAKLALQAGITTIMDCGERNRIAFDLRDAWKLGLYSGPRILVCGRAITITGGHFHWNNNCECDGPWEVRKRVRQMLMEGADFIKMMAGGGTTLLQSKGKGTFSENSWSDNSVRAFTEEELRAGVEEAERVGRTVTAHCESYDSVGPAARAGVHTITHLGHLRPDGTRGFDEEATKIMVKKGLYVDMNMKRNVDTRDALREKKKRGESLSEREKIIQEFCEFKQEHLKYVQKRLHDMGVKIIASSDGIGLEQSNKLVRSLEIMVEGGMTPLEVIASTTGRAAEAMGPATIGHMIGTITEGKIADIIAVDSDPTKNISALWKPSMVIQEGKMVFLNH